MSKLGRDVGYVLFHYPLLVVEQLLTLLALQPLVVEQLLTLDKEGVACNRFYQK